MVKSATVRSTPARPKQPKVDRGVEVEQHVRELFVSSVTRWCKDHYDKDKQPSKDVRGGIVDNLTAAFSSPIETQIEAATDLYPSTFDDDGVDEIECPECGHTFEAVDDDGEPLEVQTGDEFTCPKCKHDFDVTVEEAADASDG